MQAGQGALAERNGSGLKVLVAERRASAHSELSRRLTRLGHEVLARVTSAQGAIDYAGLLAPDVVLLSPVLEDGVGITAALTLTRGQNGIAAVVLTTHPAAADPSARPNWGVVALLPADAEPEELDAELRRVVARAREAAASGAQGAARSVSTPHDAVDEVAGPTATAAQPGSRGGEAVEDEVGWSPPEDDAIESMVDAAYGSAPTPDFSVRAAGSAAVDFDDLLGAASEAEAEASATQSFEVGRAQESESDDDVVTRAVLSLAQRTGLSQGDVLRLMQEEAADTSQTLADVARAMLVDQAAEGCHEVASAA